MEKETVRCLDWVREDGVGVGKCNTSLACSRVNRGRGGMGVAVDAAAAAAAATMAATSGSVMVVACEVSTVELSKTEDGSGEADCRGSGAGFVWRE